MSKNTCLAAGALLPFARLPEAAAADILPSRVGSWAAWVLLGRACRDGIARLPGATEGKKGASRILHRYR